MPASPSPANFTLQLVRPAYGDMLERIRFLLSSQRSWVKGTLAVNAENRKVRPEDDTAVRFCAIGAVDRVCHEFVPHEARYGISSPLYAGPTKRRLIYFLCSSLVELKYDAFDLVEWNDHEDTEWADVEKVVMHAVIEARLVEQIQAEREAKLEH